MRDLRTIIIVIFGIIVSYRLVQQFDHDVFFDAIINLALLVISIVVFIWVIVLDIREFSSSKSLAAYQSTATGLFICLFLTGLFIFFQQRDNAPSKLYCVTKIVDFNGVSLDFKSNGTYLLTSWCLGADYYRGTYSISDSIITLDRKVIEKVIVSNRLLIRQDGKRDSLGNTEKSIYQIDDNNDIIDDATDFRIIEK